VIRWLFVALLLSGCTSRAAIAPPRLPLTATPSDALPEPPTDVWPSDPLQLRLVRRELSNGLRIILSRGEPNGVVSVAFVSSATPRWDASADPVVTSWMAQMLLRATVDEDGAVVDDLLSREGYAADLELGASGLIVRARMPREELPRFVALLDRALRHPAYREADLAQRVRSQVDRIETELTRSSGLIDDRLPTLLYAHDDPRAHGMGERLDAARGLTVAQLRARHADLLDPSRSALIVTGDVDDSILAFVGRTFSAWPARDVTPRPVDATYRASAEGARGRVVVRPALRAYLRLVERAPGFTHPDYAAFLVLEQILGGMFASRMNLSVRERSGASYGFHAHYGASERSGAIEMETSVDPGYTGAILRAMIAELRRVQGAGTGITDAELVLAQTRARNMLLAQTDSSLGLVSAMARRVQVGQEPTAFGQVLRAIDALDADAVEAAARAWLRPDQAPLLMVVRPEHLGDVLGAGVGRLEVVRVTRR